MKVKLTKQGQMPIYAEPQAAGMDLRASVATVIEPGRVGKVQTDVAIELPEGYYGALVGRSGLAAKGILAHYGTIDTGYRGLLGVILFNTTDDPFKVNVGDRVAQLIVQPFIRVGLEEAEELSDTVRGSGGFGSTGSK